MTAGRIAGGLFGLALTALFAGALLYASRFWAWRFWEKDGLFGLEYLRRDGDQLRGHLRDVSKGLGVGEVNAFDILAWGLLIFLALSLLQWLWNFIAGKLSPAK